MKKAVAVIALLFGITLVHVPDVFALAQISLQNNTSYWLNLYIDGNFGCGPVMPNGFCTSGVTPGSHLLDARKRGESNTVLASEAVNIGDGTSPTWTVSLEDSARELVRRLNGARYANRIEMPLMHTEDELIIEGGTLVWRDRVLWASPEVAKAMRSGTAGFRHQTIGSWLELDRMQIVGCEANYRKVFRNGKVAEYVFIISEDGNTIMKKGTTQEGGSVTTTFYRR